MACRPPPCPGTVTVSGLAGARTADGCSVRGLGRSSHFQPLYDLPSLLAKHQGAWRRAPLLTCYVRSMKYPVALKRTEEGYSVSCPGLPGCWSQGATEEEALANIRDAIRDYLTVAKKLAGEPNLREVEVSA
jgi:predicted RNase H-like HicB family nuclease